MSSIFGRSRSPPAGWLVSHGGELTPDPTVAGYLARGREVKGVCRQRDCRRSCELDFERLARKGIGGAWVHELKPLYHCHRLGGCGLDFHETGGVELTLSMLAGRDYVGLRILCGKCGKATVIQPDDAIGRLAAEGTGGADTPVSKVGDLIRGACPKCEARRWVASVLWSDPEAAPTWVRKQGKRPPS
jgi:hypothetical protein